MDPRELTTVDVDLTAAQWTKSSYSGDNGGQCVEVARNIPGIVAVRDSKNPDGPALVFSPDEWKAFLGGAKGGEFDLS
ncbi:DUF397 domain-containing protein [Sinosporangium siamense]|uniref:DUF397 domain-containing protein n=1 Tax=Sinosporangium siamense TaxID=1367973 RepID=A0A919RHR6_9ACTN|nr:DUF397 domain-containing protein [Sinosporangium siamense]GII93552.1 hypothetical protein Ssi02_37830 [Sinosporangium siamense]